MAIETKGLACMTGLLAVGLVPSLVALFTAGSPIIAAGAAFSAAMSIGWVLWIYRLLAERGEHGRKEATLKEIIAAHEATHTDLTRELREARSQDSGTGVLNRGAFLRRLDEAITRDARLQRDLVLLVVDLEDFKAFNLARGRIDGDAILRRVGRALEDATRGSDAVGRLGGDEFGVILGECDDPGPAVNRIFKNLTAASENDPANAVQVSVGAVSIVNPSDGVDVQEVFRLADAALNSIRGTGGNQCARRSLGTRTARQSPEPVTV